MKSQKSLAKMPKLVIFRICEKETGNKEWPATNKAVHKWRQGLRHITWTEERLDWNSTMKYVWKSKTSAGVSGIFGRILFCLFLFNKSILKWLISDFSLWVFSISKLILSNKCSHNFYYYFSFSNWRTLTGQNQYFTSFYTETLLLKKIVFLLSI